MSTVKSQITSIRRNAVRNGEPTTESGTHRCPLCHKLHTSDALIACIDEHNKATVRQVCAVVLCDNTADTTDAAGRKVCSGCADSGPVEAQAPKTRKVRKASKATTVKAETAPAPVEAPKARASRKAKNAKAVQTETPVESTAAPGAPKDTEVWAKECRRIDRRFADAMHQKALFSGPRLHAGALNLKRIKAHAVESGRVVIFAKGNEYAAIDAKGNVHAAAQVSTLADWHKFGATVYGMVKGAKSDNKLAQAPQTITPAAPVENQKPAAPAPAASVKARKARKAPQAPVVAPAAPEASTAAVTSGPADKARQARLHAIASMGTLPAGSEAVQGALVDAIAALKVPMDAIAVLASGHFPTLPRKASDSTSHQAQRLRRPAPRGRLFFSLMEGLMSKLDPKYLGMGWRRVKSPDRAIAERWEATIKGHGCVVYRLNGSDTFSGGVRCHNVVQSRSMAACFDACSKAAHSGEY